MYRHNRSGSTPATATLRVASVQSFDDKPVDVITHRVTPDHQGREQIISTYVVETAWLTGQVNCRDKVVVRAVLARQPWRGGKECVYISATWTRQPLGDAEGHLVREIREPVLEFTKRAVAVAETEALLDDLAAHPQWLLAIEDCEANMIADALAIAKGDAR